MTYAVNVCECHIQSTVHSAFAALAAAEILLELRTLVLGRLGAGGVVLGRMLLILRPFGLSPTSLSGDL